ncbi:Helicase, C-terminal,Helicase superfamily 1/2, ATP-binding domain,P-loop containing nucleoside [Cinara cedri]|uniref:Helicase, C-terminal,Helicase superfamily 1/2, ATP-binding domain,P-loop containing nucleoside n=1 Tax=Cinara cedri TaxID=506608 RepID=A0A5E4MHR4_9HEMI|nr:Helicase, C-terminal,Helicase superfamily 1/2, ATP-binding domain,P-loop containing nucleoside [Cinara cedri]
MSENMNHVYTNEQSSNNGVHIKMSNKEVSNEDQIILKVNQLKPSYSNRKIGEKYKLNAEDTESISEDVLLGEVCPKKINSTHQGSTLNDLDEEEKKLKFQNLLQLLDKSLKITNIFETRLQQCKDEIIQRELEKTKISQTKNPKETTDDNRTLKVKHYLNLFQQPRLFNGQLKTHQIEGLLWIRTLYENGLNGILADDMGLGKTIQSIAFFCFLVEMGITGPFLVIAPLSTIPNWLTEFITFAPQLYTLLYHGNKKDRAEIRSKFRNIHKVNNKDCYSIIVTTYETIRFDIKHLQSIDWKFIIMDEGHKLKNVDSQISQAMRLLKCPNKLILTGTPIQNNMTELWSLLNLLMPEMFNKLEDFNSWFKTDDFFSSNDKIVVLAKKDEILDIILKILKPFILRREKKETDLKLPPKKEIVVYAPITEKQKELYQATLNSQMEILNKKDKEIVDIINATTPKRSCVQRIVKYTYNNAIKTKPVKQKVDNSNIAISLVMTKPYIQLKKIANHPYLVHMPLIPGQNKILVDENIVKASGKFQVLDAMLPKLKSRGHKVLLFSTMVQILDVIEEFLILRDYKYTRLDGTMQIEPRVNAIKMFNTDPECFLMMISTRAGGLGLNLTSADTVIIFDSDWNPQCDLQAQDRCHRMGQKKPVVVYRLCTKNTCDEKILETGAAKRKLEKLIVGNGVFNNDYKKMTTSDIGELLSLLESSEYNKKIQSNGYIFTDEELEILLNRSDMINPLSQKDKLKQQMDVQLQAAEHFKILSNY